MILLQILPLITVIVFVLKVYSEINCLVDVPFTDGDFYYDNLAFHSLHEDCIEADERSFHFLSFP